MIEDLDRILREGEGYKVDFKKSTDKDLDKDIVAFSNGQGGRIFIGINDENKIVGTDTSNSARSKIQDLINNIDPRPDTVLDVHDNIIVVTVNEGKNKPYFCSKGCFLRMGANSQKLERDEIIEFMRSEDLLPYDSKVRKMYRVTDRFNEDAYKTFIRKAGISDALPQEHVLTNLKCAVKNERGELVYTNAGALFFRDSTEDNFFVNTDVVCVIFKGLHKGGKIIESKTFNGTLLENIEDTMKFLWKNLRVRYEFNGWTQRQELLEIPVDALREAVINAACHRNYHANENIMVEIYDDRVVISNPGGLPKGITLDELGKKSVIRNTIITDLLKRAGYIERIGSGIKKIRDLMAEDGLEPPVFESTYFFDAIFKRPPMHIPPTEIVHEKNNLLDGLTPTELKVYNAIVEGNVTTANEIAESIGIVTITVWKITARLIEKGLIKRTGSRKTGRWIPTIKE